LESSFLSEVGEPDKEWLVANEAYLKLTQDPSEYYSHPVMRLVNQGDSLQQDEKGFVYYRKDLAWRRFNYYMTPRVRRSRTEWPRYAHIWGGSSLFQENPERIHMVTESGEAIYYVVSNPSETYYWNKVFALWASRGTVKPRRLRKRETEDEAILRELDYVTGEDLDALKERV
jgi:hypothetical protein